MTGSHDGEAPAREASAGPPRSPLRLQVVGMSVTQECGVRDHAALLADALARENVTSSLHWLERSGGGFRAERRQVAAWARELEDALAAEPPDAVLLHYSVFAHSHRGLPVYVPRMIAALRRSRIPVIAFMHELAFPWGRKGIRGAGWALTQRAALAAVMRGSAGAIVTVQERGEWLESRPWLSRRPLAFAPVFSTLPAPGEGALDPGGRAPAPGEDARELGGAAGAGPHIGIFGYTYKAAAVSLVLEALAKLRERGRPLRLVLLGAPGARSPIGELWAATARSLGIAEALSFSGTLPAAELSRALAACELLLFADGPGPASRKTTLAGALASGTPLVAVDGPSSWRELIDAGAVELVEPSPASLAAGIERLLDEPARAERLAASGRVFAAESMGVERSARVVAELLELAAQAPRPKVLYVMGAGRSGSTILGVALGNCDGVFFAGELDRWLDRAGVPREGAERIAFWEPIRERVSSRVAVPAAKTTYLERSTALLDIRKLPTWRRLRPAYRRASEELYRTIAQAAGVEHLVDTSHYPRRAREMQTLAGIELYLLFLVRDPRSVVASLGRSDVRERRFGLVAANAYLWLTHLLAVPVFLRQPRARRMFVRYEDLIARPAAVLAEILAGFDSTAPTPDLGCLDTGVPFHGNRLLGRETVALEAHAAGVARGALVTSLLQLPSTVILRRLRPALRGRPSARRREA